MAYVVVAGQLLLHARYVRYLLDFLVMMSLEAQTICCCCFVSRLLFVLLFYRALFLSRVNMSHSVALKVWQDLTGSQGAGVRGVLCGLQGMLHPPGGIEHGAYPSASMHLIRVFIPYVRLFSHDHMSRQLLADSGERKNHTTRRITTEYKWCIDAHLWHVCGCAVRCCCLFSLSIGIQVQQLLVPVFGIFWYFAAEDALSRSSPQSSYVQSYTPCYTFAIYAVRLFLASPSCMCGLSPSRCCVGLRFCVAVLAMRQASGGLLYHTR